MGSNIATDIILLHIFQYLVDCLPVFDSRINSFNVAGLVMLHIIKISVRLF